MVIKEGTRVKFICDNELLRGSVTGIYPDMGIAIIKTDEGVAVKEKIEALILDEDEPVESKKTNEPDLNDEITITRGEFIKKATLAISPEKLKTMDKEDNLDIMDIVMLSLSGVIVGRAIEKELFDNIENDD